MLHRHAGSERRSVDKNGTAKALCFFALEQFVQITSSSTPQRVRLLAGFLGFLVGTVGVGSLLIAILDAAGQKYATVELDQVAFLDSLLRKNADYDGPPRIVYLGDSLSMPPSDSAVRSRKASRIERATPTELRRLLRLRGGSSDPKSLLNVSTPGLTAYSHYFMSERLADLGADRFILSVNLGWFSRGRTAQQPSLSGLLPPKRWPEAARLPLHTLGLSADEVVAAYGILAAGHVESWRALQREQVRFQLGVRRFSRAFAAALGRPAAANVGVRLASQRASNRSASGRPTRAGAFLRWGPILRGLGPDDPTLVMLDALLRRLQESGARILVMVAPTNVDALEALGMYDHDGFETSLAQIRQTAERNGADFLDLHNLLPDAAFRDPTDHLDYRSGLRPASLLATQMVLWSEGEENYTRLLPSREELGRPSAR